MHGDLEFCVFRESSNCIFWNALPGVYNKGICLVSIIAWWWSVLCVHSILIGGSAGVLRKTEHPIRRVALSVLKTLVFLTHESGCG